MSDETEKNDEKTDVNLDFANDSEQNAAISEDALRDELAKAKSDYLYLRAEFDKRRLALKSSGDSALLTDDLPPAAFTDSGFVQFLRTTRTN